MVRIRTLVVGIVLLGDDPAGRFYAVEFGHADVHQHDVRSQLSGQRDGFEAVACLAEDLDICRGCENHPEAVADQLLVIGDQDAHAHKSAP